MSDHSVRTPDGADPGVPMAPDDARLANLVADLATAVATLQDHLPEEKAAEGEVMASVLEAEMDRAEPDRDRLARWTDRITAWAEDVGSPAEPIQSLASTVSRTLVS